MKKFFTLWLISGIIAAENSFASMPASNETTVVSEQPQTEEKTSDKDETPAFISAKEKRKNDRLAQIAEERAKETNRFKKKAIENTEAREKKYEEILERKQQKASRFQKAAAEQETQRTEEVLKKQNEPSRSRFTEKAKKRAEERALKREEKNKRLHRNR